MRRCSMILLTFLVYTPTLSAQNLKIAGQVFIKETKQKLFVLDGGIPDNTASQ